MNLIKSILFIFLLVLSRYSYAQQIIKGKVYDKSTKGALIGASIYVSGAANGTKTDHKGQFTLRVGKIEDSLMVSYIGFETKIVPINGNVINVGLQPSQTSLNRVIVSASRDKQARVKTPVAISTISPTTIKNTHATQLDQLLNQTAGVYMVDLGNEQHTMAMRLPIGFHVLYLYMVDGIPIRPTGITNHNSLIEINSQAVQRIEVIKGPASSIYGSRAVGGVLNFITKNPSVLPQADVQLTSGTLGYRRANINTSATIGNLGLFVGGYYAKRDVAENLHDDFHKYALNLRADYALSKNTKLIATLAYVDYKTDMNGSLDSAHFYDKDYVANPISLQRFTYRSDKLWRSRLTLHHHWNKKTNTDFTIYFRKDEMEQNPSYRIRRTSDPHLSFGQINLNAFHSYGAIIQHNQGFKWLNANWITGVSFDYSPMEYDATLIWIKKNNEGVYYDYYHNSPDSIIKNYSADLYNPAIYTQFSFNPTNKLRVVLGLRYDALSYSFVNHLKPGPLTGPANTTNTYDHLTPKIGATYDLGDGNGLYVNYSVGFNPPGVGIYTGYVVPDLIPSTFYNYEIGGWINLGDKGYAELALYNMIGTDEIVSVRLPNGNNLRKNSGRTIHRGIELSVNYSPIPEVFFQFGGTYMQHKYLNFTVGKTDVAGNKMAMAPPAVINSKITYKPDFFKGFRISFQWQNIGGYYTDAKNTKYYSGYHIFNTRLGYKYKDFELWANCLNLTNKVYATVVSYRYGGNNFDTGKLRRFQFGVGYHFGK